MNTSSQSHRANQDRARAMPDAPGRISPPEICAENEGGHLLPGPPDDPEASWTAAAAPPGPPRPSRDGIRDTEG